MSFLLILSNMGKKDKTKFCFSQKEIGDIKYMTEKKVLTYIDENILYALIIRL